MESCSLQPSTLATIPSSIAKNGLVEKSCMHAQLLRLPKSTTYTYVRKLRIFDVKAQASSLTTKFSSQEAGKIQKEVDGKDAFVAGATGKVGSRAVRELLKLGFRVRAGVRNAQRAEPLVQSVKKIETGSEVTPSVERLEIVECDLEKPNQIIPALGNASVVLCCIGASEKEVFDITGPYRIDYQATKNLIDAAAAAKVKHFIMVSSLGTNKIGFPAAILNLFWGVLLWKRKAEEALIASGIPYTIVRPGGMERPTDEFKKTHNLTLSQEDTLFGGLVSNLQVAELIAFMAKNRKLSYCKVVEAIAETTAPLTPMDKLLEKIPPQRPIPKELDVADEPKTVPSSSVAPETPSAPVQKEPVQEEIVVTRPLSPYTAYADLKPPTSPTPTPSGGQKKSLTAVDVVSKLDDSETKMGFSGLASEATEEKPVPVEAKTKRPQSPYVAYEDLKPPTSPSPTPSGPNKTSSSASPDDALSTTGGSDIPVSGNNVPLGSPSGHSPFPAYDDLKPPTSPSPTTPVGSVLTVNITPPGAPAGVTQHETESKPRPLSPYYMYEDLKPPTSPSPSPSK